MEERGYFVHEHVRGCIQYQRHESQKFAEFITKERNTGKIILWLKERGNIVYREIRVSDSFDGEVNGTKRIVRADFR